MLEFQPNTLAFMTAALEQSCKQLKDDSPEARKFIADKLMEGARSGGVTMAALIEVGKKRSQSSIRRRKLRVAAVKLCSWPTGYWAGCRCRKFKSCWQLTSNRTVFVGLRADLIDEKNLQYPKAFCP
jgi:hypothetical protein